MQYISPDVVVGETQDLNFKDTDQGPFNMPENERRCLKNGNLSSSKFVTIKKETLLKELFQKQKWNTADQVVVCGSSFIAIAEKKQLLARERRLEPSKLFELCRKRGINIGTNPRENRNNQDCTKDCEG